MISFLIVTSTVALVMFGYRRMLRYLRYFQQEEYTAVRFHGWLRTNRAWDRRGSALLAAAFVLALFTPFALAAVTVGFVLLFIGEPDPRKAGKIRLNMTQRATKIFQLALGLFASFVALFTVALRHDIPLLLLLLVLAVQAIPHFLLLANLLLSPFERRLQRKFLNEAKEIFRRHDPFTIGITGSYGKTSSKAALGHVLSATVGPTFCPPKSINTPMGITREIRERYRAEQRYAVIEMGAYGPGSIKRLCDLTPPDAAIITIIGIAHLERYKTAETVYQAKSELPQALPAEGLLICNGDDDGARRMATEFAKETTLLYGFDTSKGHLDCIGRNLTFDAAGSRCEIEWKGAKYELRVKHLGRPAVSNLLGVFTMACALGADPTIAIASMKNLDQVDNRLVLVDEGGVLWLKDAYNSNPVGFEAALEMLRVLEAPRKILITPGMVELGHEQELQNERMGKLAADSCSTVIVVGETNRAALERGLRAGGLPEESIVAIPSRDEAFARLRELLRPGDLVLVENDLPDLYEHKESF